MTNKELAAIVRGLAPAVRDYVTKVVTETSTRLTGIERQVTGTTETLDSLQARMAFIETKAAARVEALEQQIAKTVERLNAAELRVEMKAAETTPILTALADLAKDFGAVRERIAVVEVRAQVPGPAGKNGLDGKDGVDGLGFEDLAVDFDGDRTLALRFERNGVTRSFPVTLPFQRFTGVYQDGKNYAQGDTVTWAGSTWHCQEPTATKPGDGSKAWQLCVKRGRDGKDGQEGAPGRPGRDLGPEARR